MRLATKEYIVQEINVQEGTSQISDVTDADNKWKPKFLSHHSGIENTGSRLRL